MSAQMTEFVDQLPLDSLTLALSLVRGQPVSKRKAALAALNVASYAAGQLLPEESAVFAQQGGTFAAMPAPSSEEVEAAFAAVMPDESGTFAAGRLPAGTWLTILKALLPLLLPLLA